MPTAPALTVRIRADKTGPAPGEGQPWPTAGVEVSGDLSGEILLPVSFVNRHLGADWFDVYEIGVVERPSRPDPKISKGSAAVADEHRLPVDGMPNPHVFRHVGKFVIHTIDQGDLTLTVTHQPDKYVDSDDPTEPVTAEVYAEGRTRVDHFYVCTLEA